MFIFNMKCFFVPLLLDMKKKKKKRADKYEKKLAIEGTLDEVLKVSVPEKKKEKK